MARRYGTGSASRPCHRAPFQMLEITGTAQHRRVSLLSSQEPLAEQESRIASARPDLYRQRHQPGPHRKSRSCEIVSHLIRYLKIMDLRPARFGLTGRELVS